MVSAQQKYIFKEKNYILLIKHLPYLLETKFGKVFEKVVLMNSVM